MNTKSAHAQTTRIKRSPRKVNHARVLSHAEEASITQAIMELCPQHLHEFTIALNTGLRKRELYALTWSAVDLPKRRLFAALHSLVGPRVVPLNDSALNAFQALTTQTGSEGIVFKNAAGDPRTITPGAWWHRVMQKAGVGRLCWHDLRRTFAYRCFSGGVEPASLAALLGHNSMATTFHVFGDLFDAQREGANKLEAAK